MKKSVRLTESQVRRIVAESVRRIISENSDGFYSEEDDNGKTGEPGMVKSYDIGYYTVDNLKNDAEEEGMTVEEYLKMWWDETGYEGRSFTWERLGAGYGYHGDTLLRYGNVIFKDIFGQLIVDEVAPE